MGKSAPKPDDPKMSAQEKVQVAIGSEEWDHYKSTYVPVERQYLKDSQRDFGARGKAQASSAVMGEATDAMRLSALGGGVSRSAGVIGSALTEARTRSASAAEAERDARMAGALGVGRELSTDVSRSASQMARMGVQTSLKNAANNLKVDTARQAARAQMAGSVIGSSVAVGMGRYDARQNAEPPTVEDRGQTIPNSWARDTPSSIALSNTWS